MSKRNLIIIGAIVAVAIGWAVFRPELLFVNKAVDETFPEAAGTSKSDVLASGNFYGVAHETKGAATIYAVGNKKVLRFTGFETSNGPDVRVFLARDEAPMDNDAVQSGGYLDLGSIKGNRGDQNYDIPGDADLSQYHSVVIWCNRFGVNFGASTLKQEGQQPVILSQGSFQGVAHETAGEAAIYQLADGKRVLRFTDFATSNGPDVHVFLAVAQTPMDNDAVKGGGYFDLGSIKGNQGDQNYDVPADLDLSKYHSVVIWCNRFSVNFGAASLGGKMRMSSL